MAVNPLDHPRAAMSYLTLQRPWRHGRPVIKCLQPCGDIGVSEHLRPNLAEHRLPASTVVHQVRGDPRGWYLQVVLEWLRLSQGSGRCGMRSEWAPSDPKLSSALRAAAGASYGALVGAALATAITIALASPVVVPALLTMVSSGAGALLGYTFHHTAEHTSPPGIRSST